LQLIGLKRYELTMDIQSRLRELRKNKPKTRKNRAERIAMLKLARTNPPKPKVKAKRELDLGDL